MQQESGQKLEKALDGVEDNLDANVSSAPLHCFTDWPTCNKEGIAI